MSLPQLIKDKARELGFEHCGIASVELLTKESAHLREWLERGYHGSMGYLERNQEKREDIRLIMPEAKSVIVLSYNYYTPHQHDKTIGKISRYAWGDDYHEVLPPKLRELELFIREQNPLALTRHYVDTGPVMEKQWAVRAGIGWQGKHSNIISRSAGSFFFLALIITNLELEADAPMADFCGSCTACIDACPTGAIVQPYVVDGSQCLSFWTIETKPEVEFPLEIAQHTEGWLYGCDICQEVCPWNRFKKETQEERFQPRNGETTVDVERVLNMQQEEFSTRFRKSPIKRTKLAGLKRNAATLDKMRWYNEENTD